MPNTNSQYGSSKDIITEDSPFNPLSHYAVTKCKAEEYIMDWGNGICLRLATVFGISPRMRLDVTVNMFAFQALKFKSMSVFGGNQIRPNIHIQDLVNVYKHFISNPSLPGGFYNAGFENLKIIEIAQMVAEIIPSKITVTENNNDPRSYRQNSNKLLSTSFKKKFSVCEAIKDIKEKYENKKFIESNKCYTVKWMKELNL